jgi:hypothetical protein
VYQYGNGELSSSSNKFLMGKLLDIGNNKICGWRILAEVLLFSPIHTFYTCSKDKFMSGITQQFLKKWFPSTHGNVKYVYNNFVKHQISLFHSQNLSFLQMLERREEVKVSITVKAAVWSLTTVASHLLTNWLKSSMNWHTGHQHENSNFSVYIRR